MEGRNDTINEVTATLTIGEEKVELPIYGATIGNNCIDISLLPRGFFTFDPGFATTAAFKSEITYIDGELGILRYRGYPIEQLAEYSHYLEAAYLLFHGHLPTEKQYQTFQKAVINAMPVSDKAANVIRAFDPTDHPMSILSSAVSALDKPTNIKQAADRETFAIEMIAKIPTLAAMCYRHGQGLPFLTPRTDYSYTENFLFMMFAKDASYKPSPILTQALDRIFLLHADHEQNASTNMVRGTGSTGANPYMCIKSGICALSGPAHGGANEAVLKMLNTIGDVSNVDNYIERVKNKEVRLMGFGHRVYKNYDPRAKIMRRTCQEVLKALNKENEPLLKLAIKLEEIALKDSYFIERKLYPNVDFYTGITLTAMGIPEKMFTVLFALGRTSGWVSQWHEMMSSTYRIARPRQLYTGSVEQNYPKK